MARPHRRRTLARRVPNDSSWRQAQSSRGLRRTWIQSQLHQQVQSGQRRGPRLPGREVAAKFRREARTAGPLAIGVTRRQQCSPPPLGCNAGPLRPNLSLGRTCQVTQHLPTDRRVAIEQPVQHSLIPAVSHPRRVERPDLPAGKAFRSGLDRRLGPSSMLHQCRWALLPAFGWRALTPGLAKVIASSRRTALSGSAVGLADGPRS